MAIYHFSAKIIKRNNGKASVAAAAYRAGEKLYNEYDGITHDYTRKKWIEHKEIILSDNAPREYADRETLWNAVEKIEKSKDAQLAREFEVALPVELSQKQRIEVVREFIQENLISEGIAAVDVAIHNPPRRNDRNQPEDCYGNPTKDKSKMQFINPHAHILVTMRPIDERGRWEKKTEVEYICKKDNIEKGFTPTEFKQAKLEGWEKQYKFKDGRKKVWLTATEGKERELERVNRSPKTSPYGRQNEKVAYWDSKEYIFALRENWAKCVNDKFKEMQSEIRIDCRSFKDQGRTDEIPTIHLGKSATAMERRAERELREGKSELEITHSDIGIVNKQIKEHNKFVRELKNQMDSFIKKAKETAERLARKLEGIRAKIIGNAYEEQMLSDTCENLNEQLRLKNDRLEKYMAESKKIKNANDESIKKIKQLQQQIKSCNPLQIKRKNTLQNLMKEEKEKIARRSEYKNSIGKKYGFASENDYKLERKQVYTQGKDSLKLENTIKEIKNNTQNLVSEYEKEISELSAYDVSNLQGKRTAFRDEIEDAVKDKLQKKYNTGFDEKTYEKIRKYTDRLLGISESGKKKTLTEKKQRSH